MPNRSKAQTVAALATTFLCAAAWGYVHHQSAPQAEPSASGLTLFHESGCSHCHQWNGDGGHKGPDLSHVDRRLKAGQIYHQIVEGGGAMPAFGDALTPQQIDTLVTFLLHADPAPKP